MKDDRVWQEMRTESRRPDCPSHCLSNSSSGGQKRVGMWESQAIISSTLWSLFPSSSFPSLSESLTTHFGSPQFPEAGDAELGPQWDIMGYITPLPRPSPASGCEFHLRLWETPRAADGAFLDHCKIPEAFKQYRNNPKGQRIICQCRKPKLKMWMSIS